MGHQITKLREEMDEKIQANSKQTIKSADAVRIDLCKFIENMKGLIEKLAERLKKLENVVAFLHQGGDGSAL